MIEKVQVKRDRLGFVWVTLHRPERKNAIDYDVMEALQAILDEVAISDAKGLILTGSGNVFCSGGDLQVFHALRTEAEAYHMLKKMGDVLYQLMTLPKPTVALLNGPAVGGGCEIAIACDYRLAVPEAFVGFIQGNLAITTGWGGSAMLMEKLPYDKALTMLHTAKRYSAQEAHSLGFIQMVGHEAEAWLQQHFVKHAQVLGAYKEVAIRKWVATDLKGRMEQEIRMCAKLWEEEAHHRAVADFIQKK